MHCAHTLIKSTIPNYLSGLPIPNSIGGWFKLGFKDYLALIPPTAALGGFVYITYLAFCPEARHPCSGRKVVKARVNKSIKLDSDKVADLVDIEDISEKAVFCRCWKTKNWPYCDGSHNEHNKLNGDNVGPLIVKRK